MLRKLYHILKEDNTHIINRSFSHSTPKNKFEIGLKVKWRHLKITWKKYNYFPLLS